MTDTPPGDDQDEAGVLRPFVDQPREPLPPVSPPQVPADTPAQPEVPSAPAPAVGDILATSPPPVIPTAPVVPTPSAPSGVTLSRRTLTLMGAGVLVVIAGLVFLWQTSSIGGDDPAASPSEGSEEIAEGLPASTTVPTDTTPATTEPPATTTTSPATMESLTAEVETLKASLAAAPPPALPGSSLQRIVIAAGANFVSASDVSVAVVGPFGNFANIDPATNAVIAAGQVAPGATRVIRTPSSVWITDYTDGLLVWINPATNSVNYTFEIPGPDGLAKDRGSLVIASRDAGVVARFDPGVGKIVEQVPVGGKPAAIAVGENGEIWATIFDTGELVRIDPADFTISDRIPVGAGPVGIALSPGRVWVANEREGTVVEVSISDRKVVSSITVGERPAEILVVDDSLWAAVTGSGDLVQIELETGRIVTRTPLGGVAMGGGPIGISAGAGSIWVAISGEQSVVRVTPPA